MGMGWILAGALVLVAAAMTLAVRRNRRAPAAPSASADASLQAPDTEAPAQAPAEAIARVFAQLHQLAFGVRTLELHSPQRHDKVIAAIDAALARSAGELRHAPRRPMLLPQLLQAVNDSESSRREITTIIGRDPALAANLLKLANSPFYRVKAQPVESIDRAVAVLGTDGIRSLICAALLQPVFRLSGDSFGEFPDVTWDHTFLAAGAAESFATGTDADPFAAQLLGMLMGLGSIIVFRVASEEYARPAAPQPDAAIFTALIDKQCRAVARRVAAGWGLSERMLAALDEQEPGRPIGELSTLGRSLMLGRLAGALAILRRQDLVADQAARTLLLQSGASGYQIARTWTRLSTTSA